MRALRDGIAGLFVVGAALSSSGCFLFPSKDPAPPVEDPIEVHGAAEAKWHVEVGGGEDAFVALEDGAHVPIVHGVQGGSHVWASLRLEGVAVELMQVEVEVRDGNDGVVSRSVFAAQPLARPDGSTEIDALRAYVTNDFRGAATIRVRIASNDGAKWATDECHVVVDGG